MKRKPTSDVRAFVREVLSFYKEHGRHHLRWRLTSDPYAILVSEIMLQQTQVDRVIPYYERWLDRYPSPEALARAPLSDALTFWNGLGYNRRAKMLRDAALQIVQIHDGRVPKDAAALRALPGVGPYTASAVRIFAFNESDVLIETNVRAAIIHHFFPPSSKITDRHVLMIAEKAAKGQDPRTWHSALMDYGTHIKKLHKNPARRSAHHVKQSPFEGSLRQARGAILRKLLAGPVPDKVLRAIDAKSVIQVQSAMKSLESEGLIRRRGTQWLLADA